MEHELSSHNPVSKAADLESTPGSDTLAGAHQSVAVPRRTPGEWLDAGLAADQAWRDVCAEKLRRQLGRLHRLDAAAHHGAVIAGLLETLAFVLIAAAALGSPDIARIGALGMGTACLALLGISGAAASVSAWMRRRLLRNAERNAVALPTPPPAPVEMVLEAGSGEHERDVRLEQLEEQVRCAYRDERNLSEVCMWGGQSALAIWGILALLLATQSWVESDPGAPGVLLFMLVLVIVCIVGILSAATLLILPFVASLSALHWFRRKRSLWKAEQSGYEIRDPARYPGE